MLDDPAGPIERFSWGEFIVNGEVHSAADKDHIRGAGKDIRIVNGKVSAWEERHGHKLTPEMITGISRKEVDILIIGIGVHGLIKVPKETRKAISKMGIPELILAPTPEACRRYNQLTREGKRVALLAHGTC